MNCANCKCNDGLVYTSIPVQYKCTITNEYHTGDYSCDVEFAPVRHGRWIKKYRGNYLCSECGAWFRTTDEYGNIIDGEMRAKYCEECGAKMDGEQNG